MKTLLLKSKMSFGTISWGRLIDAFNTACIEEGTALHFGEHLAQIRSNQTERKTETS